ncbi:MAG: hypothetical protein IKJ69_05820 [Clostridia bacterium]|nr:hypothetical protein [Clostridia bacterium]
MVASNYLLKIAAEFSLEKNTTRARDFFDYYLTEISNLKCHDRLILGECRLCSGIKPNDLDVRMPISWEILEKQGNRILLLSEFCLDWEFYYGNCLNEGSASDNTWETSFIRKMLNRDFFENSFKGIEKNIIITTQVKTLPNPIYGNNPGNTTQDKLFLLSSDEVIKYFAGKDGNPLSDRELDKEKAYLKAFNAPYFDLGNSSASTCILMADKFDQDRINIYRDNCFWWLRTPGIEQNDVVTVTTEGAINFEGESSMSDEIGIRPAMWIDLDIAKEMIYSSEN